MANPLDYHTTIWGDLAAQTACFRALLACRFDMHLLVLDFPRADRCVSGPWQITVDALIAAQADTNAHCAVVASMPEGLPDGAARQLLVHGIAPMQGLADCLDAIGHAAAIAAARLRLAELRPVRPVALPAPGGAGQLLDEGTAKQALAAFGLVVPRGMVVSPAQVAGTAVELGFPVVVKAVSTRLAHKTEAGALRLNLCDAAAVDAAVQSMAHLSDRFLVERMALGAVAELIVGVRRDALFGLALTLGAGGVLVELLQDTATLLLPATRADMRCVLQGLCCWPLLAGYRGRPAGDVEALLDAIEAILAYALAHDDTLLELEVNPVLVLPQGRGVVAVDVLIRRAGEA